MLKNLSIRSGLLLLALMALIADSRNCVDTGSQLTAKASDIMNTIAGQIASINVLMGAIANASREQSQGIDQVNVAVSQMKEVAQQNAALVEESAVATRSLEDQAQQLAQAMAVFKISSGVCGARRPSCH